MTSSDNNRPGEVERVRQRIAEIIDPYSFCERHVTDDPALLDMVEQSKGDALRKADRVIAALTQQEKTDAE